MLEQSDEVQEVLGRSYGVPDIDEDELAAELDALGDELALDTDSSYLDDAIRAPSAPDKEPGAASITNKVCKCIKSINPKLQCLLTTKSTFFQDGVLVDEFGLPQIPAS